MNITIAGLIYRSPPHLRNLVTEMWKASNRCDEVTDMLIVAKDPTDEVVKAIEALHSRPTTCIHKDPKPDDWYLARVYRAWNCALSLVKTSHVILINSDMIGTRGWVDALVEHYKPGTIVCSKWIQPVPWGDRMIGKDFGYIPNVKIRELEEFAAKASRLGLEEGGVYQPCLAATADLLKFGGFPEGNMKDGKIIHEGAYGKDGIVGGDAYHFQRIGIKHYTAMDSLVYHEGEGEMSWETPTQL